MSKNSLDEHHENDGRNLDILDGKTILVVDDDDDNLLLMTYMLGSYGVQVMTVSSATAAMEVIQQFQLDLLIIDIAMPEEDGNSLIRKVRTLDIAQVKDIPAIALTALSRESKRIEALRSGFQVYLTKPFEPTELLIEIANLLNVFCQKSRS